MATSFESALKTSEKGECPTDSTQCCSLTHRLHDMGLTFLQKSNKTSSLSGESFNVSSFGPKWKWTPLKVADLSEHVSRWSYLTSRRHLDTVKAAIEVWGGPVRRDPAVILLAAIKVWESVKICWRQMIPIPICQHLKKWKSLLPLEICVSHYEWKKITFSQVLNWRSAKINRGHIIFCCC